MLRLPFRKIFNKRVQKLNISMRKVTNIKEHICFHRPWGFKQNSYIIEKVLNPQLHYDDIAKKHHEMSERGFFEIAAMNGHIFNRTELLYSTKDFENLDYNCEKLFERLHKDGNGVFKNGKSNSKNEVLALVLLNDKNNSRQYILRVMEEL